MQRLKRLLECEINGEHFLPNAPVPTDGKQLIPMQLVDTIIDIEEQASYIAEVQKGYKEQLKSAMRENGVKSWDAGRVRVSYTPSSTGKSFDTKKFRGRSPGIIFSIFKNVN